MAIRKIAFTLYPVTDLQRARRFYEQGLGLRVSHNFQDAWIEYALGDEVFAISNMLEGVSPSASQGGSIAFEVDDVDETTERARAAGATVKVPPFDTPVCRMSMVIDPEGNAVTIHKVTDV